MNTRPGIRAGLREIGTLGEEPVARVYRIGAGQARGLEHTSILR